MPEANNIAAFDQITTVILGDLYQTFPMVKELNTLVIFLRISNPESRTEIDGMKLVNDSIKWLDQADFIAISSGPASGKDGDTEYDATLTLKALSILKSTPESLKLKRSIGEEMKDAGKGAAKELPSKLVSWAFAAAVGGC